MPGVWGKITYCRKLKLINPLYKEKLNNGEVGAVYITIYPPPEERGKEMILKFCGENK